MKDKMGTQHSCKGRETYTKVCLESLKERDHLEDLDSLAENCGQVVGSHEQKNLNERNLEDLDMDYH